MEQRWKDKIPRQPMKNKNYASKPKKQKGCPSPNPNGFKTFFFEAPENYVYLYIDPHKQKSQVLLHFTRIELESPGIISNLDLIIGITVGTIMTILIEEGINRIIGVEQRRREQTAH